MNYFPLRALDLFRISDFGFRIWQAGSSAPRSRALPLILALTLLAPLAGAQESFFSARLPRSRYTSGEQTLRAFAPVSDATRDSIVKFNVNGATVTLGTVVDTNGLVLTKASELKKGKLTCWLATDQEVPAEVIRTDDDEDLALVRVHARGLKPIQWDTGGLSVGQWVVSPGIAETPQAVGIISALERRIRPSRALIGIRFDFSTSTPIIDEVFPGFDAEKAGLKAGDVIVALNNVTVTNREQVVQTLSAFREGNKVKLRLRRAKKEFDTEVRLMSLRSGLLAAQSYRQRRMDPVTGDVSERAEGFAQAIEHDTVLPPWLCGGPLVNLDGKAIGINIARASRVTTYALPARLVKRILADLKSNQNPPQPPALSPHISHPRAPREGTRPTAGLRSCRPRAPTRRPVAVSIGV